jgi:hypothetical protein
MPIIINKGQVNLLGQGQEPFHIPADSYVIYPNGKEYFQIEALDGDSLVILNKL